MTLTKDQEQCLALGKEVVRMINDTRAAVARGDVAYARRNITFPGGSIWLIVPADKQLVDAMEAGVVERYDVATAIPRSETN